MRKLALGFILPILAVPAMTVEASAQRYNDRADRYAEDHNYNGYYDRYDARRDRREARRADRRDYRRSDRRQDLRYARYYDNRGYYNGPVWRGDGGRYYCHREDGTTGTVIGGVAGAVIGAGVAGRGDSTAGAIIGGVLGAVLGNSIDRNEDRRDGRRCR